MHGCRSPGASDEAMGAPQQSLQDAQEACGAQMGYRRSTGDGQPPSAPNPDPPMHLQWPDYATG